MNIKLIKSSVEIIGEDEESVWTINKDDGAIIININKILTHGILECNWLDVDDGFIQIFYSHWTGRDLWAIINTDGDILREGINEVDEFLKKERLFIVEMYGAGMGDEGIEFDIDGDDLKVGVIDCFGEFIIPPNYSSIQFDEEEKIFYANNLRGGKNVFSKNGKLLKQIS